jgi:hypothetical protein
MEPNALFGVLVVCLAVGHSVNNVLKILGLTKVTVVKGGNATYIITAIASLVSFFGWALCVYMLLFQGAYVSKVFSFVFSG